MAPRATVQLGVLASGRGTNFAALADASREGRLGGQVALLLVDREDALARREARSRGVPELFLDPGPRRTCLTPETEIRYVETLRERGIEVVLLAGFMRVLHERFLGAFPMSVLNIHPSLLPAFPGLHAARQALEHGVALTGCTVHLVDDSVDGGPILGQAVVPVQPDDDLATLEARLHEAEHRLYPETVRRFLQEPFRIEGRRVRWGGPRDARRQEARS